MDLYFDYAASSPLLAPALVAMERAQREDFANPSGKHRYGRDLLEKVEQCRREILQSLLPRPLEERLLFTSSATESNNLLVKGLNLPFTHIFYHPGDHPSLTVPAMGRAKEERIVLCPFPLTPHGEPHWPKLLEALKKAPRPLLLFTSVHNQTGVKIPVDVWAPSLKEVSGEAFIHVDAVQGYGREPLGLDAIDSLTLSSHKIGGPKGIGALFIRRPDLLTPLLLGGGQEYGLRSSTLAAPLIFGLHAAAMFWSQHRKEEAERATMLSRELRSALGSFKHLSFPFPPEKTVPYILGIESEGLPSDLLLRLLEEEGVVVASASSCSPRTQKKNMALAVLNWPLERQQHFLRLSFGHATPSSVNVAVKEAFGRALKRAIP